jgi:hypothetical protein
MVPSTEEDMKDEDFREGAGCGTSGQKQRVQPASVKTTSAAQSPVEDTEGWGSSLRKTENDFEAEVRAHSKLGNKLEGFE